MRQPLPIAALSESLYCVLPYAVFGCILSFDQVFIG